MVQAECSSFQVDLQLAHSLDRNFSWIFEQKTARGSQSECIDNKAVIPLSLYHSLAEFKLFLDSNLEQFDDMEYRNLKLIEQTQEHEQAFDELNFMF